MARSFERAAIRVPGAPNMSGYSIRCHKCGKTEKVSANGHTGSMPPEGIAAKFRNKGWLVGNRESGDVCPDCQDKQKKQRIVENKVVPLVRGADLIAEIKAEPPREMSKEDRRLIFAKVNDVYLDETSGYSSGWSDKRVAEDLGVPQAWVKTIREDNFGAEGRNEDFGPIVEEAKKLLEAITAESNILLERMQQAAEARSDLLKRADHIAGRIAKLEKAF